MYEFRPMGAETSTEIGGQDRLRGPNDGNDIGAVSRFLLMLLIGLLWSVGGKKVQL